MDATRHAIPAAREFARASGFADASTLFYLFFVITTPFVAVFYFKFVHVRAALPLRVKLILWAALIVAAYLLSAGADLGPPPVKGFKRTFNLLVTSSWFGSSQNCPDRRRNPTTAAKLRFIADKEQGTLSSCEYRLVLSAKCSKVGRVLCEMLDDNDKKAGS